MFFYFFEEGQEDEFCKIYDTQTKLYEQGAYIAACMYVARIWLEDCWKNHKECHLFSRDAQFEYPRRLIDLGDPCNEPLSWAPCPERIKVIEVGHRPELQYIAVSYRWPRKPREDQQLNQRTRGRFRTGFRTADLPRVYSDAFTIARMLGIRYVWIDALCIVQGIGGDWHTEASKMASVYGNAIITVAFGDAPTPFDDHGRNCSLQDASKAGFVPFILGGRISEFDKQSLENVYSWLQSNKNFPARPVGQLDQRGWTFQERLLSRRILTITKKGLFWDCCCMSASDRRPLGFRGDYSPQFQDSDEKKIKKRFLARSAQPPFVSRADIYAIWRRILQDYSKRKFSFARDRVIAIEGVVQCLGASLKEQCFLGLWEGDAIRSLVWFCDTPSWNDPLNADENAIEAPSWSWASVSDPIHYKLWHPSGLEEFRHHSREDLTPCAALVSIWVRPADQTTFSRYVGVVKLRGSLAKVPKNLLSHHGCRVIWDRPTPELDHLLNGGILGIKSLGSPEPREHDANINKNTDVYVLPMFKENYSTIATIRQATYCLVLEPERPRLNLEPGGGLYTTLDGGVFRRIGIMVIDAYARPFCVEDPSICQDKRCPYGPLRFRPCRGKRQVINIV
ncbi:het domain protein [Colletotrichum musicola]|uniref:Het domain protein n=1 Tax=Colletotrichum musicola TaxID=2175873 RepID=A0A8H6IQL1_9PEZI|nr:het domain protein [Colletotrichum musicola]